MKTPAGYIICIFVPFMMLIIYQGIKSFVLFRTYKRQQLEDMQTERDQLANEREKNAQMLAEIEALKARLDKQDADGVKETADTPEGVNDKKEDAPAEKAEEKTDTSSGTDA